MAHTLTHQQLQNLSRWQADRVTFKASSEAKALTAAEAKPLVAKGLIESAAKPKGFGNSRAWKLTEAGKAIVATIRYSGKANTYTFDTQH